MCLFQQEDAHDESERGKFKDATGYIEAFGLVDFDSLTTTLRYRGEVCYVDMTPSKKK